VSYTDLTVQLLSHANIGRIKILACLLMLLSTCKLFYANKHGWMETVEERHMVIA